MTAVTAPARHSPIHHETVVIRDGRPALAGVASLVPGDLIELRLGDIRLRAHFSGPGIPLGA
jgi:hypothetical protein